MYLLVNPWIHDFSVYDLWMQPLGLLYLAGILEENGVDVHYINCLDNHYEVKADGRGKFSKQPLPTPQVLHGINRRFGRYGITPEAFRAKLNAIPEPDGVLVTSGMTYWYPALQETIRELRQHFPATKIFLGGIYATLMPQHAKESSGADVVFSGQSEMRIMDLIGMPSQKKCDSIHDFPLPAWYHTQQNKYRIVYSSRGCPYRCTFCASDILNADVFIQRSVASVFAEIEKYYLEDRVEHVVFYDDALLINHRRHLEPILRRVIDNGFKLKFHTPNGLNAREIDAQLADLMFQSGFATIRISLESVNPEIQKNQGNRKVDNTLFRQAISNLYRAGYHEGDIECYLIMGLPGQTRKDVEDSLEFVADLGVIARLATFSPIPGTVEARAAEKFLGSRFFEEPLLQNHSCFPLRQQAMSEEELQALKWRCNENNTSIRSKTFKGDMEIIEIRGQN
jgi:radical SAM superfamily enzyme YgiQ (UPF0313 family)